MTCIVGLVQEGIVFLGGDSAASNAYQLTVRRDPKVFVKGEVLMGCTTSHRFTQLLHYAFVLPDRLPEQPLEQYMAVDFVNALRTCLQDGGFAKKKHEQERGGRLLVGVAGRLFCIEQDYQIGEAVDGYDAVGCGDDLALGALCATRTMALPPIHRLELALEAAAHHGTKVRGPFVILQSEPAARAATTSEEDRRWRP